MQFSVSWNKPLGNAGRWSFEGFADFTSAEGSSHSNLLTQPQLLYHPGKSIAFGIEYQYWKNRLGLKGLDESTPQALLRYKF